MNGEQLKKARISVPEHVVYRDFPLETVVLNLESGQYHGLNPVAGVMLTELGKVGTINAAAPTVAEQFGQEPERIEADMLVLVQSLLDRGVLEAQPVD